MELTPEQEYKYIRAIENIELAQRPEKWKLIKKLTLELHPQLAKLEAEHSEACKELRIKNKDKHASSKSGTMRNTMKMFGPILIAMYKLDPQFKIEMSGKNKGLEELAGKQLYDAFPEYRIARAY